MSQNSIILSVILLTVLASSTLCVAQVVARDGDMQVAWRVRLPEEVTAFASGKLDGATVLVVAANRTVYVFDKDGRSLSNTTVPAKGKIYALAVGDVDADGKGDIVAGVGWTEADNIDLDSLYPPPDGLPEEEKLLYKILKSKGSLYMIKGGKAAQMPGVDQWVRSIKITDINGDKNNETVVVSGGFLTNYYKEFKDIIRKEWVINKTRVRTEPSVYTTNITCHCSDCSWDARDVTKDCYVCWWNNAAKKCIENHTIEDYQWNKTTVRDWDLSESTSANASIAVYDNSGNFKSKVLMPAVNATFMNAQVVNLYHDNDEETVLGAGGRIYVLSSAGNVLSNYPFGGDIRHVYTADLSDSGNEAIILEQKNMSAAYMLIAISREGRTLWSYSTNSTKEAPVAYMKSAARDGISEMLFSLSGTIYALDDRGYLSWSYRLKHRGALLSRITALYSTDLDADGADDIIVALNNEIYDFEPVGSFIDVQRAKKYFDLGNASYVMNHFAEAKTYLENAKQLYQKANDVMGLKATDLLLNSVNSKLTGDRRTDAEALYAKALTFYSVRDYAKAKKYAIEAKAIYLEIGDTKGVSSCDSLTKTIDGILAVETTIATTSIPPVATTAPSGPDVSGFLRENSVLLIVVVILILIGSLMMRHKEASKPRKKPQGIEISEKKEVRGKKVEVKLKGPPINEKDLKKDWNELEEKWKKLEDI